MTTRNDMQDTMDDIDRAEPGATLHTKNSLLSDIANLKKDIMAAQKAENKSNEDAPSYAPISPEQANLSRKTIVFLKKDLTAKQSEYEELV